MNAKVEWQPAGIFKGLFDGYKVLANKHVNGAGQVAWHTRSFLRSRAHAMQTYWVVDGKFHRTIADYMDKDGQVITETEGEEPVVNPPEEAAIRQAIAVWCAQ